MNEKDRIIICGSMSNYDEMLRCEEFLTCNNIPTIIPQNEEQLIGKLSSEEFNALKRRVSIQYLHKIRDKGVFGILVVNAPKKGVSNYIGANTFAEIAMAFCWYRKIFILHDLFEDFVDELIAWQAQSLHGDLNRLVKIYGDAVCPKVRQLSFQGF